MLPDVEVLKRSTLLSLMRRKTFEFTSSCIRGPQVFISKLIIVTSLLLIRLIFSDSSLFGLLT